MNSSIPSEVLTIYLFLILLHELLSGMLLAELWLSNKAWCEKCKFPEGFWDRASVAAGLRYQAKVLLFDKELRKHPKTWRLALMMNASLLAAVVTLIVCVTFDYR